MDEISSTQPPGSPKPLSESELRYYYFGFYRTLRKYRTTTLLGWVIVAWGCASFPVGWSLGRPGGVIEILLSCATVAAGLILVSRNISCLESYLKITLPSVHEGTEHPMVHEIIDMMRDVDEGGWQEARAAMKKMLEMEKAYSLPPLN